MDMRCGFTVLLILLQLLLPPGVCYCRCRVALENHESTAVAVENTCCQGCGEATEDCDSPVPCEHDSNCPSHGCRSLESAQTWRARSVMPTGQHQALEVGPALKVVMQPKPDVEV